MNARARKLSPQRLLWRDDGITVWLVQHDSQELWLMCWYRLNCPQCGGENGEGGIEFDVREVPGFTEPPRWTGRNATEWMAEYHAERQHHADIIARAMDDGWRPEVGKGGAHHRTVAPAAPSRPMLT